jgi:stage II sporulation protein AA (anti-sigma F factor antagonist)
MNAAERKVVHMELSCLERNSTITLCLHGELDHHAAQNILLQVGDLIDGRRPERFVLDMSGVSFMDSSGIAVILGAFRRMNEIQGEFHAVKINAQARRVLTAAGIDRIVSLD